MSNNMTTPVGSTPVTFQTVSAPIGPNGASVPCIIIGNQLVPVEQVSADELARVTAIRTAASNGETASQVLERWATTGAVVPVEPAAVPPRMVDAIPVRPIPEAIRGTIQQLTKGELDLNTVDSDTAKAIYRYATAVGQDADRAAAVFKAVYLERNPGARSVPTAGDDLKASWTPGTACPLCQAEGHLSLYAGFEDRGNTRTHRFADCRNHEISRVVR
jgi:hypothetical protein